MFEDFFMAFQSGLKCLNFVLSDRARSYEVQPGCRSAAASPKLSQCARHTPENPSEKIRNYSDTPEK